MQVHTCTPEVVYEDIIIIIIIIHEYLYKIGTSV